MKNKIMILMLAALLLLMAGCRDSQPVPENTIPTETEPVTEAPTQAVTENPFEFESEIDFSDFETVSEPEVTEPEPTQESVKPTAPQVNPTEPTESPTEPTEPEATDPEVTETPTTAKPSIGADGYNNQIVRP